jgi:hypothetical protein
MIAGWLAGKVSGLIIFCVACLAIPLAIGLGIQTVRLDGVSLFGWHVIDGALYEKQQAVQARDLALKNYGICQGNEQKLNASIIEQNAKILILGRATANAQAAADEALKAAQTRTTQLQAAEARILAAKPGADQCKSADTLILESVK